MISSHGKISIISLISRLSLKLYLNSLVYHRNIFAGSSLKVFGDLRKSSEIFGNSRKMFGNVRLALRTILKNLRKVVGNVRKIIQTPSSVCLYNKKNITRKLEDMNFMFEWQEQYLTSERSERVRYCSCHSNIKFISSSYRVISSIYFSNLPVSL